VWFERYESKIAYIGGKKERNGEGGSEHWQAWAQFKGVQRQTAVQKMFPGWHVEPCAGTEAQNEQYCQKTATQTGPFESFGQFTVQGRAGTYDECCRAAKGGMTEFELWDKFYCVMVRHHKGILRGQEVLTRVPVRPKFTLESFPWPPITDWTKSHLLVGPSGIGKTEFAIAHFANPLFVRERQELADFQAGFHDGIVFDDFRIFNNLNGRGDWTAEKQIHLLDVTRPTTVRVLYGKKTIPAETKKIFTHNERDVFDFSHEAIRRRVTVTKLSGPKRAVVL